MSMSQGFVLGAMLVRAHVTDKIDIHTLPTATALFQPYCGDVGVYCWPSGPRSVVSCNSGYKVVFGIVNAVAA